MLTLRCPRRTSRLLAVTLALTAIPAITAVSLVGIPVAAAAGICATPGASGGGGSLSGVINTYYPGSGTAAAAATAVSVGSPSGAAIPISAGDLLLIIQMQGADIDSANSNAYGHGGAAVAPAAGYTALNNSGLYEYVRATSSVLAGSVGISGLGAGAGLINTYSTAAATATAGQRTFQVIRVPQYTTATTSSGLTASAWNGASGGVLAIDTTGTLTLAGTVSVDGLGFRGGVGIQQSGGAIGLANTDVAVSATLGAHGQKAEGIAGAPAGSTSTDGYPGGDVARGAPGNAGGGGTDGDPSINGFNSGGGGGGNGGTGGTGGNSYNNNLPTGGYGGVPLPAAAARVFLGGGGGAGTDNNSAPPASTGAAGGGIVLVRAASLAGAGSITANGGAANNITGPDGGGGGGAGGTIVVTAPSASLAGATLAANGGRGGDAWNVQRGPRWAHGPGGGGGGGWILTSSPPSAASVSAGAHGVTLLERLTYGSSDGTAGQTGAVAPGTIPGASGGAECADLSITKTGPATVNAAGAIAYTLSVSNAGPATATGVSVLDTLPPGVTFVSATGAGWACVNAGNVSVTCTRPTQAGGAAPAIAVTVAAPAQGSVLTNTASVTATTPDPVPANNTSTMVTTVIAQADLSIAKTGPATVSAGASASYALAVADAGPSDAANVSVTDTLPAGVAFGSAAGAGWTCSNSGNVSVTCTLASLAAGAAAPPITVIVTAPAQGATLSNVASVTSSTADPVPANNTSSISTTVSPSADLSMTKSGPATVAAGASVTYTLVAASSGPSDAAGVVVTDTLPAGVTFGSATGAGWTCTSAGNVSVTCTRAALAAGATAPSITVVVTAPAQAGFLTNTASVSSTTADPSPGNNTSVAGTTVNASADLSLTKTGPATVTAGGSVSYSLTAIGNGPSDASNVSVTDTLPAGVTFGSASGSGWTCTHTGNVSVSCTRPSLAAGATAPTITVVVTAPPQAASLSNTASVASTTTDPNPANNTSTAVTAVTASADLSLTKTGPPTVTAAGSVSYSLVAVDNGPSDAANVSVTDTLPSGVTFVSAAGAGWTCTNTGNVSMSCTRPSLAAGATAPTITVMVTAPAQTASLTNTASVASTTADSNPGNNVSSVTTGVTASADLSITKAGAATAVAGSGVAYALVVTDNGPSDAANLAVTDTLPAGVTFVSSAGSGWTCTNTGNLSVSCTRPSLAAGATAPTITVVVTAPAQAASLSNTASVSSTTADPAPANNTATANTTVTASADLTVLKTGPATVVAGAAVSYALVVGNAGPSDAANVSVTDTLPAGVAFVSATGTGWTCTNTGSASVTCTRPALATGTTAPTITIVITAGAQATSLTNTASVASTTADPAPGNNTSVATTTVTASADLSVTKTGPATVVAGGTVTYSLVVVDHGPSDAANVSVADTLPAGVTFVSAAGGGWTCTNVGSALVTCTRAGLAAGATAPTITVVVTAPAQSGTLSNTASVSSTTADPLPGNNTSSTSSGVSASADLALTKTGPTSVAAGSSIGYSLSVTNNGPSDAANLQIVDTLPPGVTFVAVTGSGWTCANTANVSVTCTRPALATGATAPAISLHVTAPNQATVVTNTAVLTSSTTDPNPADNVSSVTTSVGGSADLSITKSGPATVVAGATVTYHLAVTDAGPSDAGNLSVVDVLPAGVAFVSAGGAGWACTNSANVSVTCSRSSLTTGTSAPTITVVVTAPPQAGSLSNTASVAATTADPNPANNTASVDTAVTASADLSMTKTGPPTVAADGTVAYGLVVANNGPSDAANVQVTDTLPAGVTFVSAAGAGWTCTATASVSVSCTRAALATGATAPTIAVIVTAPPQAGSLSNTASVASTTADPAPGNNTSSVVTGVSALADLALTKTGPASVVAGGTVTYALVVVDNGPSDAAGVSVTDTLPAGVTFVAATGAGWTCINAANASITCTRPALAAAATAPTIAVVVTAPVQAASMSDTASVSSATADPFPANNTASASTLVTASADLAITKTGPATVVAGATVAYLVTVTDVGPSNASGVTVTDTLPAGVSLVAATGPGWTCTYAGNVSATCTRPVLAAGTSAPAITVTLIAPPQAGTLANTAFVASTTADPNPANNTATATTAVTASADLSVAKTGPATVSAGAAVTYNLVVMNSGPSDAGNISVTDTLPAGVRFVSAAGGGWTCTNSGDVSATCTRATLAAGATAPLIALTVTAPAAAATLTDTAVVSSGTPDPVPGNNTSSATTTVTALADLAITKTGPATVTAAGTVSYALVVVDNGPSAASTVVVTDTLPAGVTLVSAAGPGWACTHSGNVLVTCARATLATGPAAPPIAVVVTAPTQGGTLSNTASVAAATTDPNLGNNSSSVATTVDPSADLSIVKSGPSQVQVGASIRYLLAIKNAGPSDARLLTVTDTLPAGVTFVSAAGAGWACLNSGDVSVTCTRPALQSGAPAPLVTVVVTAPGSAGTLTNSADVTSATFDPVPGNNTSTWITSVGAAADLSLSKTGPAKVAPGSSVVYELTVTNHGPSDATAVVVTDTLPAGVTLVSVAGAGWTCTPLGTAPLACHLPGLTSGTTTPPITVTVTAPAHAANLVNTAAVSSAVNDPVPGNNTSAVTTAVGAVADLSLVKTGPARVDAGSAITYRLVVSNAGPDPAAAVVVNDTLPSGVTYVSAAGSGWSCNHVADVTVNCTRASLASGTSAPPVLVVVLGPDVATTLVNVANVAAATFDPVAANNGSTASTAVFALVLAPLPRTGGDGLISGPVGLLTLVLGVVLVTAARRWSD